MKVETSYVTESKWKNFAISAGFCLIFAISMSVVFQGMPDFDEVKVEELKSEDVEVKRPKLMQKCDSRLNYWAVSDLRIF